MVNDEPIGIVMPVTSDDTSRSLGTIFHVDVFAEHRGRGYGRLLLRKTVEELIPFGVRRVVSDINKVNNPMIRTFEEEGRRRLPIREVPITHLRTLRRAPRSTELELSFFRHDVRISAASGSSPVVDYGVGPTKHGNTSSV